jgi:hypothetical protein
MGVQGRVQSSYDGTRTERVGLKTTHVISQGKSANGSATNVVLRQRISSLLQNLKRYAILQWSREL